MSLFKWLIVLLAIAISLIMFFHINILQSKHLLLFFGGALIILLIIAFLEMVGQIIGIIISIAAFLFLVYLIMLVFKMIA